jgi:hypothetical protein
MLSAPGHAAYHLDGRGRSSYAGVGVVLGGGTCWLETRGGPWRVNAPGLPVCYSAEASFAAAAVLVPAGVYCVLEAARKKPRWLALAAVPVLFGIQQGSEGFVWLGLGRGDPVLVRQAALTFLFYALAFWPFWLPFVALTQETQPGRRRLLLAWTVLTTGWFWALYYPLLTGPESLLTVRVHHHSIEYAYSGLAVFRHVPARVLDVIYVLTVTAPLLVSSERWGRVPALVVAASAAVTAALYFQAFVSVWCFFAAGLTLYLVWLFRVLPERDAARARQGEQARKLSAS